MDPDLPPPPPPEHVIPVDVDQLIDTCTKLAAAFRHVAELFARAAEQCGAIATLLAESADDA